ncbi:MAG: hypothetical protein PHE93_00585 [Clostridia bacterium]|nr:hypothetical protein [Clostridia bacterium]
MKKIILIFVFFAIWCIALSDVFVAYAHETNSFDYKYKWMNNHVNIPDDQQCDQCNYYDLLYYHSIDNNLTFAFNPQNYLIDENNDGIVDFNPIIIKAYEYIFLDAVTNYNMKLYIYNSLCCLEEIADYNSADIKVDFTTSNSFTYAGLCELFVDYSLPLEQRMHTIGSRITIHLLNSSNSTFGHELGHALGLGDLDEVNDAHHSNTLMGYYREYDFLNSPTVYELQGLALIKDIMYQEDIRFYEPHPSYYDTFNKINFSKNNTVITSDISGLVEKGDPSNCVHDYRSLGFYDNTIHYEACWNCYDMKTESHNNQNIVISGIHYLECSECFYFGECGCVKNDVSYNSYNHTFTYSCGYVVTLDHNLLYNIIPNNNTYHLLYCGCGYSIMQKHKLLPYGDKMKCNKCNYVCNEIIE